MALNWEASRVAKAAATPGRPTGRDCLKDCLSPSILTPRSLPLSGRRGGRSEEASLEPSSWTVACLIPRDGWDQQVHISQRSFPRHSQHCFWKAPPPQLLSYEYSVHEMNWMQPLDSIHQATDPALLAVTSIFTSDKTPLNYLTLRCVENSKANPSKLPTGISTVLLLPRPSPLIVQYSLVLLFRLVFSFLNCQVSF